MTSKQTMNDDKTLDAQSPAESSAASPARLGPIARMICRLLVPARHRASFIGDLLEERALLASDSPGPSAPRFWIWRQIIASAPSLLMQQIRQTRPQRATISAAMAIGIASSLVFLAMRDVEFTSVPAIGLLVGLAIAIAGLMFSTPGLRLLTLAFGTVCALVGDAMGAGALGPIAYMLFTIPTLMYTDNRRCGTCRIRPKMSGRVPETS